MAPLRVALAGKPLNAPAAGLTLGERVRLRVRSLASSGAGVADLPDGRVVFVHRTAPGDVVDARIVRLKARWGEAVMEARVEEGPTTVAAPCPLFARCGGCTLQHLPYPDQLAWKRRFVTDAMTRIGGSHAPVATVVPSPSPLRYRNRVTFTVRRLRGGRVVAGFHALGDPGRIVDVDGACLLPEPAVTACWETLRAGWARGRRLMPSGGELRVTVRSVAGGVVLVIRGGARAWDPAPLVESLPDLAGVWHQADGEETATHVAGAPAEETWGDDRIPVAGHAFLQVNRAAARLMVDHVLSRVGGGPATAVDAYCGVGVYGRALARMGWTVAGIELDAHACRGARSGAPTGFTVREGRVEDLLPSLLPVELVLLNPPRAGLHESIPSLLARHRGARLVYVSCDPATLARDAARLAPAYRVMELQPFDLFPQTSHVETVAVFTPVGEP